MMSLINHTLNKQREFLHSLFSSWPRLTRCQRRGCSCLPIKQNNGLSGEMGVDCFSPAAGGIEMRGPGYPAVNLFNGY